MRGIPGRVGVGDEEDVLVRRRAEAPGLVAKINGCLSGVERERERERERKKKKKGIHRISWTISNAPCDMIDVSHEVSQRLSYYVLYITSNFRLIPTHDEL